MRKIILSIILLIMPIIAKAEVNYEITDYYIESHILENGDLQVKELFVLDGSFNGYERDIAYSNNSLDLSNTNFSNNAIYNANGIYDVSIKAKHVEDVDYSTMNDNDFDLFDFTEYANNGSKAKYQKSTLDGLERYRMYYYTNNNRTAFYLNYTIDNVVVMHNDIAEIYWNFIGSDYADDIKNLNIKVYLPKEDTTNNFRIWAHGGLTGKIDFLKDNELNIGAVATIDTVEAYNPVDIRMTFDKSLITDSTDLEHSEDNALNEIIEVETARANEANELREALKTRYFITKALIIIFLGGLTITFIHVKRKYGTTKKSNFDYEYNREFIDDYNVEVIDYLLNRSNISSNAMSASIMNMIYKKNIQAEEILSKSKKKKDYKFTLITEDNLNETEKNLINFLFKKVGYEENGVLVFTTIALRNYADSTVTYSNFINSYTSWKKCVIKDGKAQNFYENVSNAHIHGILWFVLSIILLIVTKFLSGIIFAYIMPIAALIFLFYTFSVHKKTEKGSLHYDKWMAFKNFLKDFGNFKEKELPEIILWERYLVYAVIFGVADKVRKDMNVKIKEMEITYGNTYSPTFTNIYIYNSISDSVNYSVSKAITNSYSRQAAAHSSSSSGSGFGGGFSSGGGFGGGGGGGRGF